MIFGVYIITIELSSFGQTPPRANFPSGTVTSTYSGSEAKREEQRLGQGGLCEINMMNPKQKIRISKPRIQA
jgi:hypothetical protein